MVSPQFGEFVGDGGYEFADSDAGAGRSAGGGRHGSGGETTSSLSPRPVIADNCPGGGSPNHPFTLGSSNIVDNISPYLTYKLFSLGACHSSATVLLSATLHDILMFHRVTDS